MDDDDYHGRSKKERMKGRQLQDNKFDGMSDGGDNSDSDVEQLQELHSMQQQQRHQEHWQQQQQQQNTVGYSYR